MRGIGPGIGGKRVGEWDELDGRDLRNVDTGFNRIQAIQGLPWRGGRDGRPPGPE